MVYEPGSDASQDEVRAELERVLSSEAFEASQRNRKFLSYVVEETLSGRGSRIKAYSIATRVFGRSDDFDPLQDSIVRIEAARLRRALESYYLRQAEPSALHIVIPKGTYAPDFHANVSAGHAPAPVSATAASPGMHMLGPRIMVRNFEQDGDIEEYPRIGTTLTRQVVAALTRFTDIFVYGFETTEGIADADGHPGRTDDLAIDYELLGTATITKTSLRAELLLRKMGDGRFVWVHDVELALGPGVDRSHTLHLCAEIAGHAARTIALRDGVIDSQARDSAGNAPLHFSGYQKLLDFQDYWRTLDPSLFEPLRRDLEQTIAEDPTFSAAFACLSMLYSNAARYGYTVPDCDGAPLNRALELAKKAILLASNSSRAFHARAIAEWFSGLPDESLATLQIARSLNPNDPELLAELGLRRAMRMEWEAAVPLLEEAYIRNPLQSGQYRMGLFLCHFAEGRHERALRETHAMDAPGIAYIHLAAAAALSELGRLPEAQVRLQQAEALSNNLRHRLNEDLAFRQVHPDLTAMIGRAITRIDADWRPPVAATGLRRR